LQEASADYDSLPRHQQKNRTSYAAEARAWSCTPPTSTEIAGHARLQMTNCGELPGRPRIFTIRDDLSTRNLHDHENAENTKPNRVLHKEVTGPHGLGLVLQEASPGLGTHLFRLFLQLGLPLFLDGSCRFLFDIFPDISGFSHY